MNQWKHELRVNQWRHEEDEPVETTVCTEDEPVETMNQWQHILKSNHQKVRSLPACIPYCT
jgi:hypothetical protein